VLPVFHFYSALGRLHGLISLFIYIYVANSQRVAFFVALEAENQFDGEDSLRRAPGRPDSPASRSRAGHETAPCDRTDCRIHRPKDKKFYVTF
jgi:hypothetical protein